MAEVEGFVDLLRAREDEQAPTRAAAKVSVAGPTPDPRKKKRDRRRCRAAAGGSRRRLEALDAHRSRTMFDARGRHPKCLRQRIRGEVQRHEGLHAQHLARRDRTHAVGDLSSTLAFASVVVRDLDLECVGARSLLRAAAASPLRSLPEHTVA